MTDVYNLSVLGNSNSWVEYMLVFNAWTGYAWLSGIVIVVAIIVYTVAKYNLVPTPEATVVASFTGFMLSGLLTLLTYQGIPAVLIFVPFLFLCALGFSMFYIQLNK